MVRPITFHGPIGDLTVVMRDVSEVMIETNNRGQSFIVVKSGKKIQRVNCGTSGAASTFMRNVVGALKKEQKRKEMLAELADEENAVETD